MRRIDEGSLDAIVGGIPTQTEEEISDFGRLLGRYQPVSLVEMDGVALLNRVDTKHLLTSSQIFAALISLYPHYRVLQAAGTRISRYRTIYFDTEDFDLYMAHHSGRPFRYKLRSRQYLDSGLSFLEVKAKGKRDRTVKRRIRTRELATEWPGEEAGAIWPEGMAESGPLEPRLESDFYRITLVGREYPERVTLNLGLRYSAQSRSLALPGLAIVEVKQDGLNRTSPLVQGLRSMGVRPAGFSKYCVGVALLYPHLKHNGFKPQLRLIQRLIGGDYDA